MPSITLSAKFLYWHCHVWGMAVSLRVFGIDIKDNFWIDFISPLLAEDYGTKYAEWNISTCPTWLVHNILAIHITQLNGKLQYSCIVHKQYILDRCTMFKSDFFSDLSCTFVVPMLPHAYTREHYVLSQSVGWQPTPCPRQAGWSNST